MKRKPAPPRETALEAADRKEREERAARLATRNRKYREFATARARIAAARARHLKAEAEFKVQLDTLDAQIRQALLDDGLEGVHVRGYHYTPSHRDIAEIFDRDAYLAFASRVENRDLLYKAISMEAARERWIDAGVRAKEKGGDVTAINKAVAAAIPGVRPGKVPTLSVKKAAPTKGAK